MLVRFQALVAVSAFLASFGLIGRAQDVVSAQSGVIHYMEGTVLIDDVPLDHKPGTFPLLKDGSVLRTTKGRVEVMLTPGTFLRLDENTSIKMISSALTATRIEFTKGSIILDALSAQGDIPIQLVYSGATVKFAKPGLYRIDSDTEVLQTYSGQAVVKQDDKETPIDDSRLYFFELATDTKKFDSGTQDEFLDWAQNRNQQIAAENQATQADADDSDADANSGLAPFNYNSPLGNPGNVPSLPNYGSAYPYSVTPFNSYGMFYFNSFGPANLFPLTPIITPAIIVTHWPTHPVHVGSSNWPHPTTWPVIHSPLTPTGIHLPAPHPVTGSIHPNYARPVAVPHVAAPAVHVGAHR